MLCPPRGHHGQWGSGGTLRDLPDQKGPVRTGKNAAAVRREGDGVYGMKMPCEYRTLFGVRPRDSVLQQSATFTSRWEAREEGRKRWNALRKYEMWLEAVSLLGLPESDGRDVDVWC